MEGRSLSPHAPKRSDSGGRRGISSCSGDVFVEGLSLKGGPYRRSGQTWLEIHSAVVRDLGSVAALVICERLIFHRRSSDANPFIIAYEDFWNLIKEMWKAPSWSARLRGLLGPP